MLQSYQRVLFIQKIIPFWLTQIPWLINYFIPRVRVGYKWAIIIWCSTSASGTTVLLKMPTKCRESFLTLFGKTTVFQLVFNFEQTHSYHIWRAWYSAPELHHPMIQFLIILDNWQALTKFGGHLYYPVKWYQLYRLSLGKRMATEKPWEWGCISSVHCFGS